MAVLRRRIPFLGIQFGNDYLARIQGKVNGFMSSDSINLRISFDQHFAELVGEGNPNPLLDVRVRVGGEWFVGSEESYAASWMAEWLVSALVVVPDVVSGEKAVLIFRDVGSWLVFEPVDANEQVRLAYCHLPGSVENPSQRREFEPSVVVSKKAWVSELVRAARKFTFRVVEVNPELVDDPYLVRLREAIQEVEAEYPEYVGG